MVSLEKQDRINYQHLGDKEQYLNHLTALAVALGAMHQNSKEHTNARETLSHMLLEMLPTESQLK